MTRKEQELSKLPKDAHHPYGMSTWSPRMECPCWDGRGANKNTEAGTKYHALFAETLQGYLNGEDLAVSVRASEEQSDHLLKGTVLACLRVVEKYIAGVKGAKAYVEKPVQTFFGIWGRADVIIVAPGKLTVVDFKTFYNPGRDHTPQLAGYAIGALCTLGLGENYDGEITLATVYGDTQDKDTERVTHTEELAMLDAFIVDLMDDREAGTAKPRQCNWCDLCKHAPGCKALRVVVEDVAKREDLAKVPENWASLTSAQKAQSLVLAEVVTKWADAVKAAAKESALAGEVIEDSANGIRYALVERKGRKTPRAVEFLRLALDRGIPVETVAEKLSISATNAVAILKGAGVSKKDAEDAVARISDIGEGTSVLLRK